MTFHRQNLPEWLYGHCRLAVVTVAMTLATTAWAQQSRTTVSGVVADTEGNPLPGAVVRIEGTDVSTVTDIDGRYKITFDKGGKATVSVSYIGFDNITKTINKAGESTLDITMTESGAKDIDEVVVTGYNTIKKESLSAAISTIGAKDIARTAAVNTSGALVGKIAGVNTLQSSGRPGNTTSIKIRNMGTPLFVIDGVQQDEGIFNNLDFNDIESISVLKDASAAIYGLRAANGVILVTTKMGKRNQKSTIGFNTYYGWQSPFRLYDAADASTYVRAITQSSTISGQAQHYSEEEAREWMNGTRQGFNWKKYIFKNGAPQWYGEVNATGGSDKISYYLALSHTYQDSQIRDLGNFHRTNVQLNVDANITKNFRVKAQVNGKIKEDNENAFNSYLSGDDVWFAAYYGICCNLPTLGPYANDNPNYPQVVSEGGYNNFAVITGDKIGKKRNHWRTVQGNLSGEWEPIKDLKLKGLFSYYFGFQNYSNRSKSFSLYNYNQATDTYSVARSYDGVDDSHWAYVERLNAQVNASYKHTWKNAHFFDVFAGMETYKTNTPSVYWQSYPTMNALKVAYFNELNIFAQNGDNTQARMGFMGRANYDYKHRYLLEVSARYDGSWKFAPSHRWGFFPSMSAAWRLSEEPLWHKWGIDKYVNNLKLRVSYGLMGDDSVSGYSTFDYLSGYTYNTGTAVIDGEVTKTSSVRSLPKTNVSWIKSKALDIGIDVEVLDSRLSGTIDYFRRLRTGLLASRYDIVVPSEIGFDWPSENLNSDLVQGFDASLKWQDNIRDFNYYVGGNVTLARSYNWEQYKPRFTNSRNYYVYNSNHRVAGASWTYVCIGQFTSWEQINSWPVDIDGKGNSTMRPGDLIYEDMDGDGIITEEDMRATGYQSYDSTTHGDGRTPILNFGLNLGLSWKGIDFAADFAGAAYITKYFNWESRFPYHANGNMPDYILSDMWHLSDPFDANSELIPGHYPTMIQGQAGHINYVASTFWMKNMWYLKLRTLQLGYTFPKSLVNKCYIQNLRVYVMAQNLFAFDNVHKYGLDPEITNATGSVAPTTRAVNIGLNITF